MSFTFSKNFIYRTPINHTNKKFISDEMIYLASPILLEEYQKNKEDEKVKLSIKKYVQRASSRCTPFGLFAGCGVGEWSSFENGIESNTTYNRQTRLDMNATCEMAAFFTQQLIIKKQLKYFPNNSFYKIADKIRYVEYTLLNKMRSYQITAIEQSEYLNEIIQKAQNGVSYVELTQLLIKYDVTEEEAEEFINELITSQVLLSNLYPNVTGEEFFKRIIKILKCIHACTKNSEVFNYIIALEKIEVQLDIIDKCKDNNIDNYKAILHFLKEILPTVTEENLFQADLYYHYEKANLFESTQIKILDTMQFLSKLYPAYASESLKKFKENYSKRYESQEKSLLEVLDTECGIGFKSKDNTGINILVDDIFATSTTPKEFDLKWNTTYSILFKKLVASIKQNQKEVIFTDDDVKDFKDIGNTFPPSMAVFFSVLDKELNSVYFKHAGGSSASNLLGRFAHGHQKIQQIIEETTNHENDFYKDKIIAEIIHLPESRIGNVLLRPHIHNYEIAYLANSTKDKNQVIDLNDLYVSIVADKVILRSKKLNKEIIPRLTTAHNYSMSSLPVYQFLCELQNQNYSKPSINFNWGPLANEFEFLPRAVYKDVVLTPATWHVSKKKFEEILNNLKNYNVLEIKNWQKEIELPNLFLLSDGDNELLVDVNDELSIKAFLSAIKKRDSITLTEFLHTSENCFVKDKQGNGYTNELIAIVHNQEKPELQINAIKKTDQILKLQRSYITGSEWLYYKIYCSSKSAENILINSIYPFVLMLQQNEKIEKWFFIRYADPEPHIRIRFKINQPENISSVASELNRILFPLVQNSLIEKVVNDTYNREIERYGSKSIDLSELLFEKDSLSILNLISQINDDEQGDLIKMKYACYNTLLLIQHFDKTDGDLMQLIDRGQLAYFTEHGGNKDLKLQLDNKYRKYRKEIDGFLLDPSLKDSEENSCVYNLSQSHFEIVKPIISKIKTIIEAESEINLSDYIFSLVHMHINRLFKSKQRVYELLMYDFLQRSLKSIHARKLKNISKPSIS
jgi:lantibiotic biosynthesis protein